MLKCRRSFAFMVLVFLLASRAAAARYLVRDGQPNAQIVVSKDDQRPRMVNLAALELQYYIEKMSGARLPIRTEPNQDTPVKIYVGKSEHTERLGVETEGLKYGAFRIVPGPDYLALIGKDVDFTPPEPWPRRNGDHPRAIKAWDKIVGDRTETAWGYPFARMYKKFWNPRDFDDFVVKRYGEGSLKIWDSRNLTWTRDYQGPGGGQGFWEQDESGSLNAVYGWLRSLGCRWYMPVEDIGEVVPERKTIPLPATATTERPDFRLRSWFWYNYGMFPFEHVMWARRLGMNSGYRTLGYAGHAHGLAHVHGREEMQKAHPEYYSLYRGKRDTEFRGRGHACLTSEGFFRETVNFSRFMYDHYDEPQVSLWPMDGFHKCGCESCGKFSANELVWNFVDRVARELYKTHPDRLVTCGAYTPYIHPPGNVDKFTPNVAVMIANCGRPHFDNPVRWNAYRERLNGWRKKVAPGNILRVENNRFGLGRAFPVIHAHNMAKDLRALKGISQGECCEEAQSGGRWHSPGMDHLTLYVQARFLWNAGQDVDDMLDEYYRLFYGPVHAEMKRVIEFAENNYNRSGRSPRGKHDPRLVPLTKQIRFGEMARAARAEAGDTVYGKRIQVLIDELPPLEELRKKLAEQQEKGDPRKDAPIVKAFHHEHPKGIAKYEFEPRYGSQLRKMMSGMKTTFQVHWDEQGLYFDIRCQEEDMAHLNVADDVWEGDSVVIVLESPSHSFYQIEINPDGKVYDADRSGGGKVVARWASMADVKTGRGDGFWSATVRCPVRIVGREGAEGDPYNFVIAPGLKPGQVWYFNVARRRKRDSAPHRKLKDITGVFSKTRPFHLRKFLDPDGFARLELK